MAEKFEYELLDGKHPDLVKEELAIPIQYMVIVRPGVAWDEHYVSMVDDRCYITLGCKDYPIVKIGKEQAGIGAIYSNGGFNLSQLSDVFEKFPYLKHIKPEYLQAWAKENLLVVYHHSTPEELENGYAKISSEFMLMPIVEGTMLNPNYASMQIVPAYTGSIAKLSGSYDVPRAEPETMNFSKAIKTCYKKSFDFTGRASRAEFWYFQLFQLIILLVLLLEMLIYEGDSTAESSIDVVMTLIGVVNFFPNLAVGWRRMHDINRSGIFSLYPFGVTAVCCFAMLVSSDAHWSFYLVLVLTMIIADIRYLIWLCKPSAPTNEYGEPAEQ